MEDNTPLYQRLGIARDEGLMAAYIPAEASVMEEYPHRDGTREFVVYAHDGRVIDMLPTDSRAVKWWLVRCAAREKSLDIVEPFFACPAAEFRVESLPAVPRPAGTKLAIRQFSRGPWISLNSKDDNGAAVRDTDSAEH